MPRRSYSKGVSADRNIEMRSTVCRLATIFVRYHGFCAYRRNGCLSAKWCWVLLSGKDDNSAQKTISYFHEASIELYFVYSLNAPKIYRFSSCRVIAALHCSALQLCYSMLPWGSYGFCSFLGSTGRRVASVRDRATGDWRTVGPKRCFSAAVFVFAILYAAKRIVSAAQRERPNI